MKNFQMMSSKEEFQEKLSFVLALQYVLINLKNILTATNSNLMKYNDLINTSFIIVFILLYIGIIIIHFKYIHFSKRQLIIMFSIIAFWLVSIQFNTKLLSHLQVINYLRNFVAYSFTAIFFLPMVENPKKFIKKIVMLAYYASFIAVIGIVYFFSFEYLSVVGYYDMTFGGAIAFLTILLLYDIIRKFSMIKLFIVTFFITVIVLYGSRTPLVIIITFIILHLLSEKFTVKKGVLYFLGLLAGIIFIININIITSYFFQLFLSKGFYSRTLYMFIEGRITEDSGRFDIYRILWSKISESPFLGYGAGGSSLILPHGQSHSLILDTFVNLGLIFGALFFLLIILFTIVSYRQSNKETRKFIFLLVASFFPIGLIQQSFWGADTLWLLIAINILILNENYIPKKTCLFEETVNNKKLNCKYTAMEKIINEN